MNALLLEAANDQPLNQAALAFLKREAPGWTNPGSLYVVNLIRWGLDEAGISLQPPPHPEQLEDMLNRLDRWLPAQVMQFLTNPENIPDQAGLTAEELQAQGNATDAATMLLDQLASSMIATGP